MTTPTYSPATSPAATAKRSQAIDPWDAPYFGGPVYFEYRASATLPQQPALASSAPTPSMAVATAPERLPLATDPWDAPYFGGPIYLRFPAFSAPAAGELASHADAAAIEDIVELTPEPSQPVASPSPAEPVGAIADAPSPARRRGWLAGLFGR